MRPFGVKTWNLMICLNALAKLFSVHVIVMLFLDGVESFTLCKYLLQYIYDLMVPCVGTAKVV